MNTKQTDALNLALESMSWTDEWRPEGLKEQAITAIREALAERCVCGEPDTPGTHRTDGPCLAEQPAQPIKQGWDVDDLLDKPKQPAQQQEPVAYMGTDIEGNPNKFRLNPFGGCVPLYEKPQSVKVWDAEGYDALCQQLEGWKAKASKPWVGLTDEEIKKMHNDLCNTVGSDFKTVARATETKLREKNA